MSKQPKNHNQPWTPEDINKIGKLANKGIDTPKIANILGRTETSIRSKASEEEISLKPIDK